MLRLTHDHDDMTTLTAPTTKGWRSDVFIFLLGWSVTSGVKDGRSWVAQRLTKPPSTTGTPEEHDPQQNYLNTLVSCYVFYVLFYSVLSWSVWLCLVGHFIEVDPRFVSLSAACATFGTRTNHGSALYSQTSSPRAPHAEASVSAFTCTNMHAAIACDFHVPLFGLPLVKRVWAGLVWLR